LGSFASNSTYENQHIKFKGTLPWPAAHVAYSLIRPKSQIPNISHDGTLSIENFMLMMKKPKNLEFEPQHPKNVLLASVARAISCLLVSNFFYDDLFTLLTLSAKFASPSPVEKTSGGWPCRGRDLQMTFGRPALGGAAVVRWTSPLSSV
jgi:hypothetical protein